MRCKKFDGSGNRFVGQASHQKKGVVYFRTDPPSKHRMKNISTNIESQHSAATETTQLVSTGIGRRSFMRSLGVASSVLLPAAALCGTASAKHENRLHKGDVAILRFLAAAELIE